MRSRAEIEKEVGDLLRRHSITSVPIPVNALANGESVPIVEQVFRTEVSGALIRSNGISAIAVNSSHSENRRRFTVAHELGHYILKHKGTDDHVDWEFTVIRRDGRSSEASNTEEIEANAFAANLLMPTEFLKADLRVLMGPNGEPSISSDRLAFLARKYQVSETAMSYRLINLGLISPI